RYVDERRTPADAIEGRTQRVVQTMSEDEETHARADLGAPLPEELLPAPPHEQLGKTPVGARHDRAAFVELGCRVAPRAAYAGLGGSPHLAHVQRVQRPFRLRKTHP